jgi:hypothetical protein
MALQSAAAILTSTNFWELETKTQRYIHHQFQDYGYRLAVKLGDVQHKAIYIRLAKTEERFLIERALNFALDYHQELNKGKLFMWKLKQLRAEREAKQNANNFSFDYVQTQTKLWRGQMAQQLSAKQQRALQTETQFVWQWLQLYFQNHSSKQPQCLELNSIAGHDAQLATSLGFKLRSIETAKPLVDLAARLYPQLKLTYKADLVKYHHPKPVDLVWAVRLWDHVPLGAEAKWLSTMASWVKPTGLMVLALPSSFLAYSDSPAEAWDELIIEEKPFRTYKKLQGQSHILELAHNLGYKQLEQLSYTDKTYLILQV